MTEWMDDTHARTDTQLVQVSSQPPFQKTQHFRTAYEDIFLAWY